MNNAWCYCVIWLNIRNSDIAIACKGSFTQTPIVCEQQNGLLDAIKI